MSLGPRPDRPPLPRGNGHVRRRDWTLGAPPAARYPEARHEQDRQVHNWASELPGGASSPCGRTPREGHEPLSTHLRLPGRTPTTVAAVVSVAAVLAVQLLLFPIPFGVWLQGAVLGLLGSL